MLRLLLISLLLLADYCSHAFMLVPLSSFAVAPPYIFNQRKNNDRGIEKTKLFALGDSGDYLSKLSGNNARRDDESQSSIPIDDEGVGALSKNIAQSAFLHNVASTVTNEVERRTSEIDTQLSLLQSDIKSLAERSIDQLVVVPNVLTKVTRRGTRDFRRTTLITQQVVKKNTNDIFDNFTTTGKGLLDIHFFDDVVSSNNIKATEIVKWIESQTRSGTTIVSSKAKTIILKFTNKEEYNFGDVTKELVHRVVTQEINMKDVILLLKILLALGATIGPIAELLPFTLLIEALNISLETKVGGTIVEVLSKTLDNRLVAAMFTTDDKSLIGDVIKRSVLNGVLDFTGKKQYESGDIQRAVIQQVGQDDDYTDSGTSGTRKLSLDIDSEFEEWDRLFVEKIETEEYIGTRAKIMDMKIALALEECEAMSRK